MDDAPVSDQGQHGWLLRHVANQFMVLLYADREPPADALIADIKACRIRGIGLTPIVIAANATVAAACTDSIKVLIDLKSRFKERYDAEQGTAYLVRPDQHIAARWRKPTVDALRAALARATCN